MSDFLDRAAPTLFDGREAADKDLRDRIMALPLGTVISLGHVFEASDRLPAHVQGSAYKRVTGGLQYVGPPRDSHPESTLHQNVRGSDGFTVLARPVPGEERTVERRIPGCNDCQGTADDRLIPPGWILAPDAHMETHTYDALVTRLDGSDEHAMVMACSCNPGHILPEVDRG